MTPAKSKSLIRPWREEDLPAIKHIAAETAWFGEPMAHGYGSDPEVVAWLRVLPYLEHSPDLCWVAESNGEVVGYLLGVENTKTHHEWLLKHLVVRLLKELMKGRLRPGPEDFKLLLRQAINGGGSSLEGDFLEAFPAHLHINFLPGARGQGLGKQLMEAFRGEMASRGVPGIHLGTSNRNVGADTFFRACGFHLVQARPYVLTPGLGGGDCEILIYSRYTNSEEAPPGALPPPLPYGERAAAGLRHHSFRQLVPGPGLPPDVPVKASVNNCDIVKHQGEYYLAYRTAKTHFATGGADLVILKSKDFETWRKVAVHTHEGYDFREPRFVSMGDKLFFYYFASTDNPSNFDPVGSFVVNLSEDEWLESRPFLEPGWVPWRIRKVGDELIASAYWAKDFHRTAARDSVVQFFTSKDGFEFQPLTHEPQMAIPGCCETDFTVMEDGLMVGAVRNEVSGGHIFRAVPSSRPQYSKWQWEDVPERLDSPLVFQMDGRVFLACRRLPEGSLREGLPEQLPDPFGTGVAWLRYWMTPKRTALYEIDPVALTMTHLFDLPGKGDTAFAAVAEAEGGSMHLVNYTCPLDGWDKPWLLGQLDRTVLTHAILTLEP